MTCIEIECIVARYFNIRQHIIVPNVSWGLDIHECDLLVVTKSGYATEVEIKVSKSDLKKDATKKHAHSSKKIKYLYFAIPEKLEKFIDLIPSHAGIMVVREYTPIPTTYFRHSHYLSILRQPEPTPHCRPLTESEVSNLGRLGSMRIWGLKDTVVGLLKDNKHLKANIKALEKQGNTIK